DEGPGPSPALQGGLRQRDPIPKERAHAPTAPPDDRAVLPPVHDEGQGPDQLLLPAQGALPQHLGREVREQLQGNLPSPPVTPNGAKQAPPPCGGGVDQEHSRRALSDSPGEACLSPA
ncbi:unnamed protein product, partial [Ectocarpus sp. 12 AP-2014]